MIQLNERNKISVAPHFFNYNEYFRELNKSFRSWTAKQVVEIKKKYGKECMQRIGKGEIPTDEQTEKRMEYD